MSTLINESMQPRLLEKVFPGCKKIEVLVIVPPAKPGLVACEPLKVALRTA